MENCDKTTTLTCSLSATYHVSDELPTLNNIIDVTAGLEGMRLD